MPKQKTFVRTAGLAVAPTYLVALAAHTLVSPVNMHAVARSLEGDSMIGLGAASQAFGDAMIAGGMTWLIVTGQAEKLAPVAHAVGVVRKTLEDGMARHADHLPLAIV